MSVHMRFDEIRLKQTVRYKCAKCGKRTQTTLSTYQTINPFNVDNLGQPKTRERIGIELQTELARKVRTWKSGCKLCTKCYEEAAA